MPPSVDEQERKVSEEGRESVSTTPVAASGCVFFRTMVKVTFDPVVTLLADADIATPSSGAALSRYWEYVISCSTGNREGSTPSANDSRAWNS
jgi:hypothetical protein